MTEARLAAKNTPHVRDQFMTSAAEAVEQAQAAQTKGAWPDAEKAWRKAADQFAMAHAAGEYDHARKDINFKLLEEHGDKSWKKIQSLIVKSDAPSMIKASSLLSAAQEEAIHNRRQRGLAMLKPLKSAAMNAKRRAKDAKAIDLAPYLINKADNNAQGAEQFAKLEQWPEAGQQWRIAAQAYDAALAQADCEYALKRIDTKKLDDADSSAWQRAKAAKKAADAVENDFKQMAKLYREATVQIKNAAQ